MQPAWRLSFWTFTAVLAHTFHFLLCIINGLLSHLFARRSSSRWQGFCLPTVSNTEGATAFERTLLELQTLRSTSDLLNQKNVGVGAGKLCFNEPSSKFSCLPKFKNQRNRVCSKNKWLNDELKYKCHKNAWDDNNNDQVLKSTALWKQDLIFLSDAGPVMTIGLGYNRLKRQERKGAGWSSRSVCTCVSV